MDSLGETHTELSRASEREIGKRRERGERERG